MYNPNQWNFCKDPACYVGIYPYWMDDRHVQTLYEIVSLNKFKKILEVGCFDGFSTSGLISAINDGITSELHLCDIDFRPALFCVVNQCKDKVFFHRNFSVAVIDATYDFLVIDGDHSLKNCMLEYALLQQHQIKTFLAHDVCAQDIPHCDGPAYFLERAEFDGWHYLVDGKERQGEWTDRGLLFATKDKPLFDIVEKIWRLQNF